MQSHSIRPVRASLMSILCLTLSLSACSGGEDSPTPASPTPTSPTPEATQSPIPSDTPTPTDAPNITPTLPPPPDGGDELAAIVTSNYSQGSLSLVDGTTFDIEKDVLALGGDTIVEGIGDHFYFMVSAFGGPNALEIRNNDESISLYKRIELGNGVNPRDVVIVNGKGYVSLFNGNAVVIFDPTSGEILNTITFGDYSDSDGDANPLDLEVQGNTLFVGLARIDYLNGYAPASPGKIAAINLETEEIDYVIDTTGFNLAHIQGEPNGNLLVSSIGAYGTADGGIERINVANKSSDGFVFTDDDLNTQDQGGFTSVGPLAFMAIGGDLVALDLPGGEVLGPVDGIGDLAIVDAVADHNGRLWLSDGDGLIWVYDVVSDALETSTGLDITDTAYGIYDLGFAAVP